MDRQEPGILIYVCRRVVEGRPPVPRQWVHEGIHVRVQELPCSGKTDPEYIFSALESGAFGVLVVACPKGECRLGQGNYRAEVRVRTIQRLLAEIGMEPERAELAHCAQDDDLRAILDAAVKDFCALGRSAVNAGAAKAGG